MIVSRAGGGDRGRPCHRLATPHPTVHHRPRSYLGALLEQAQAVHAGFDLGVLAQMIQTIGRFDDSEIPLTPEELPLVRAFFTKWARELG